MYVMFFLSIFLYGIDYHVHSWLNLGVTLEIRWTKLFRFSAEIICNEGNAECTIENYVMSMSFAQI